MQDFGELKRQTIAILEREEADTGVEKGVTDEVVKDAIGTALFKAQRHSPTSYDDWERAERRLFHSMKGFDVIDPLMNDRDVSEIMINGTESIFYEKNGAIQKFDEAFESEEDLYLLIERIVSGHNRKVNLKEPIVDTKTADGSRVHIVLPPVSLNGPVVTIRRFLNKARTLNDLINCGGISKEQASFLSEKIKNKETILISGGTSSGKTTMLNALIDEIDGNERIITVEDSAELKLSGRENAISMECRNKTVEGVEAVTLRDLIKASLRMRPDRIIVGEVRGPEALDLMQALNTGHNGSLCTLHANSCKDALLRLEVLILMAMDLPLKAIKAQIVAGVDYIVQMKRDEKGIRKVSEIVKVCGIKKDEIMLEKVELGG